MLTQRTARGCYMTFPLTCTSKWWLSTAVGTRIIVETSVGSEFISPPCQSTIMWSRGLKTTIWEQHWGLWFKPVTLYCTWCSCPVSCILITLYYPQKFEIWKSFHSTVRVIIFLIFFSLSEKVCAWFVLVQLFVTSIYFSAMLVESPKTNLWSVGLFCTTMMQMLRIDFLKGLFKTNGELSNFELVGVKTVILKTHDNSNTNFEHAPHKCVIVFVWALYAKQPMEITFRVIV